MTGGWERGDSLESCDWELLWVGFVLWCLPDRGGETAQAPFYKAEGSWGRQKTGRGACERFMDFLVRNNS